MHLPTVGERAVHLPWLWPDARSFDAFAQTLSPNSWNSLRRDPGALLLILRNLSLFDSPTIALERLCDPRILELALQWNQEDRGGWVDWRRPAVLPIYQAALAIAHRSRILAGRRGNCDENAAWTAGLLAPLGWFAVAAVDPNAAALCISNDAFAANPAGVQVSCWGLDHAAITRRLVHRWQLPEWLGAVIGQLEMPASSASSLGADPALFATVQLAIVQTRQSGLSLGIAHQISEGELSWQLGIDDDERAIVEELFQDVDLGEAFEPAWQDPREATELSETMRSAIGQRRAFSAPFLDLLERDLDRVHHALLRDRSRREDCLRNEKLAALAEFAAGASHEINNPLAVILGQSQYMLKTESSAANRRSLESIIRQTQRISAILAELMQFARPPLIDRQHVALGKILASALEAYRGWADEVGVRLDGVSSDPSLSVDVDPKQLQTAVGCLVRNAVEAAALVKGWVRISAREEAGNTVIVIEDNGPGMTALQREHMFDPFFSGRVAGRGRGLGLPTAWRLAKEHGGDVRHEPTVDGVTRFVLTLPTKQAAPKAERKIA